jgi:hypothetical protein
MIPVIMAARALTRIVIMITGVRIWQAIPQHQGCHDHRATMR